jgi:hypothetical protein
VYFILRFELARRTEFGGLPARLTRDLALRASVETEINASLERIADAVVKVAEDCKEDIEDDDVE